jgi:hypothetical protein
MRSLENLLQQNTVNVGSSCCIKDSLFTQTFFNVVIREHFTFSALDKSESFFFADDADDLSLGIM